MNNQLIQNIKNLLKSEYKKEIIKFDNSNDEVIEFWKNSNLIFHVSIEQYYENPKFWQATVNGFLVTDGYSFAMPKRELIKQIYITISKILNKTLVKTEKPVSLFKEFIDSQMINPTQIQLKKYRNNLVEIETEFEQTGSSEILKQILLT